MKQALEALGSLFPVLLPLWYFGPIVVPAASPLLGWSHVGPFKAPPPGPTLEHLESLLGGLKVAEHLRRSPFGFFFVIQDYTYYKNEQFYSTNCTQMKQVVKT